MILEEGQRLFTAITDIYAGGTTDYKVKVNFSISPFSAYSCKQKRANRSELKICLKNHRLRIILKNVILVTCVNPDGSYLLIKLYQIGAAVCE